MYEEGDGDYVYNDFDDDEGEYYYEDEEEPIQRESIKDLKKKAKEMKRTLCERMPIPRLKIYKRR